MSGVHARLSASAAHRWMRCPGSVRTDESSASEYAAAGTFAHWIAACCLESDDKPEQWLGNKTIVDGFTVECTQEMVDAVKVYITYCRKIANPDAFWVEMPLLDALKSVDADMGGTADFVTLKDSTLDVVDLKYGSGTFVDADDNDQLKIYALGAMIAVGKPVTNVNISVVQPRFEGADPIRTYKFKAYELLEFVVDLQEAADRTREKNPTLVAGEHCKFCPNAKSCPELEKRQHALIASEFGEVADMAKLAQALASIPLVKERIKAIEEFAYSEACKGVEIPGYKLVDKRPVRRWRSEADVVEWAQAKAIEPWAPREVLSPAQLEKLVGKKNAGDLAQFTEAKSSGTVLVPVSDSRPPAKSVSAVDFDIIEGTTS